MRMRQLRSSATGIERAGAFVEFAILLPPLFVMLALFWDIAINRLLEIRHQSVANQMALVFKYQGLNGEVVNQASGLPEMKVSKLTMLELTEGKFDSTNTPRGFLPKMNYLARIMMNGSGTGSKYIEHNMAIELWYVHVCRKEPCKLTLPSTQNTLPAVTTPTLKAGFGDFAQVAGEGSFYKPESPIYFYRGTLPRNCFGRRGQPRYNDALARFRSYTNEQIDKLLKSKIPIGTKIIDVPDVEAIKSVSLYSEWKPIVFWMMCSEAPKMFDKEPHYTLNTFFLDRELAL